MFTLLTSSTACGRGKGPAMHPHRGIGEGKSSHARPLTAPLLRNGSPPLPQVVEESR